MNRAGDGPGPHLILQEVSALSPGRPGGLLREITLALASATCLTLLGGSDGGGSLLLDVVAGQSRASHGRITLGGIDLRGMPQHQRGLGIVSERDPLFPHLSVRGNLAFPLHARGVAKAERSRRVDGALALLGLEALADTRPASLDAAAAIRTAIARALVFDPTLLLLDDPFGSLDPAPRLAAQRMLRRLVQARRLTVLMTTTNREEALLLGDEIGVLDAGRLHQVGPALILLDRPATPTVASSIGDANLLPGRIIRIDDDVALVRLACGHEMEAEPSDAEPGQGLQEGAACVLCVRPERIATAFVTRPGLDTGTDSLPATLLEGVHLGDHLRLRFRLEDGTELLVRRPPSSLPGELRPDRPALLAWQPHQARVFADGPGWT
ncbi:ABC transporter ATP-binding protein [Lichenicola sp.]|uniref:ABC transporter ATP-binding protein n=1 Tax=Lichenicola sp. TaxID=2804529 RepID=UPI003AFFDEB3